MRRFLSVGYFAIVSQSSRRLSPALFGIAIVALALGGCKGSGVDNASPQPLARVTTVSPQRASTERKVSLVGHVEPWEQAILYSRVAGYLESISVFEGDRAEKNQVLAVIDDPETRFDLVQREADLAAKKAVFDRLAAAQSKAPDLVKQVDVDLARGEFESARSAVEQLRQRVSFATIRAPFSGVVTDRWVDPGALIQMSTTSQNASARIVRVMSIDSVRVQVQVPENEVVHLRVGQKADIRLPALPDQVWNGTVTRFAKVLDRETRTMPAEIDVANPGLTILPGMFATVSIAIPVEMAQSVPSQAVVLDGASRYLWVDDGGKARRIKIAVLQDDGVRASIEGQLTDSTRVILARPTDLAEGMAVEATLAK